MSRQPNFQWETIQSNLHAVVASFQILMDLVGAAAVIEVGISRLFMHPLSEHRSLLAGRCIWNTQVKWEI